MGLSPPHQAQVEACLEGGDGVVAMLVVVSLGVWGEGCPVLLAMFF
jgi:hypothetical protein